MFAPASPIQSICVFLGSSIGARPEYKQAAVALGTLLGKRGIRLVYGGSSIGLMGTIADAALAAGGEVVGVIPQVLVDHEIAHRGLTELVITNSMHERKAEMARRADAFVALPGGIGTFEELFEVWAWTHLGLHTKPCALLNVEGYYDQMVAFLDHAMAENFLRPPCRRMLLVFDDAETMLDGLAAYMPPVVEKWIGVEQT